MSKKSKQTLYKRAVWLKQELWQKINAIIGSQYISTPIGSGGEKMYTAMQKAVNLVNQFVLFFSNLYQFLAQKASYADYRRFASYAFVRVFC